MNENSFPLHNYAGARALRQITGLPVRETLVFGLRAGAAYPIDTSIEEAAMEG